MLVLFIQVYCDGNGWTLVARFSNKDGENWMRPDGQWWYDITTPQGNFNDPSDNADAISSAFWLLEGTEFKVTRTIDTTHEALLTTTTNCLGKKTFREKIASLGDFRGAKVWSSSRCLGSCSVSWGGHYTTTHGFQKAGCSGSIAGPNKVSFWCDYGVGDGSVVMIGGGGGSCDRADHGLGITEENAAKFGYDLGSDFGFDPGTTGTDTFNVYGLNLWVRTS